MRVFATTAAVLLLTGCGSSEANHEGAPRSAPTSPRTSTTKPAVAPSARAAAPKTLTRQQAAARYMALAKPINAIFAEPKCKAAESYMIDGGTWPPSGHAEYGEQAYQVLRDCHKRLMPLYEASIRAEQTTPWPVDAKADVASQVLQDEAFLYCMTKTSKATSSSAMYQALQCFPQDDGSADRVRARFGLPGRGQG